MSELDSWPLYKQRAAFVLGFHGTDKSIVEQVIAGKCGLDSSNNSYDWLGPGVYFWESDPQRALEWAQEREGRGKIREPDVVGAIIDLGYCLDLSTQPALMEVGEAHGTLVQAYQEAQKALPRNTVGDDLVYRELDCQVIKARHEYQEERHIRPYDSVRSPFVESESLYDGAGFRKKTHIQVAVLAPACIKGYFLPIRNLQPTRPL